MKSLSEKEFVAKIKPIGLTNEQAVIDDWKAQKKLIAKVGKTKVNMFNSIFSALVPTLFLVICLLLPECRRLTYFHLTLICFLACILPYVLVSHFIRYQQFLVVFDVLFYSFALGAIAQRAKNLLFEKKIADFSQFSANLVATTEGKGFLSSAPKPIVSLVRWVFRKDRWVFILVWTAVSLGSAYWLYKGDNPDGAPIYFGFEYGDIAVSWVQGNGYGNVFSEQSGPSAWQLPLVVSVFALVFLLFGIKTLPAALAVLFIKDLVIASTAVLLVSILADTPFRKYRYWAIPVLLLYYFINPALMYDMDDVVFIWLFSVLLIKAMKKLLQGEGGYQLWVVAFLVPITSPALALSFLLLLGVVNLLWAYRSVIQNSISNAIYIYLKSSILKASLLSVSLFAITMSGWTLRNHHTFGKAIPSKPNVWFEFYLANLLDEKGLLSSSTFFMHHPSTPGCPEEIAYTQMGEQAFLQKYQELGKSYLQGNFPQYTKQVFNRFTNIFLYTRNFRNTSSSKTELLTSDEQLLLEKEGLFSPFRGGKWVYLDQMTQAEFTQKIRPLKLAQEAAVIADWAKNKKVIDGFGWRSINVANSLFSALFPFLCLLIGIAMPQIRKNPYFWLSAICMFSYTLPYLLVSHYFRYQQFLIIFDVLFIVFAIAGIFEILKKQDREYLSLWAASLHKDC